MNKIIDEVLTKIKEKGECYIVGGFLRDLKLDKKANDVDMITNLTFEDLIILFPNLNFTEKGKEAGIFRFNYKGILFEISTYINCNPLDSLKNRDFTINSLYYDGVEIHDLFNSERDFDKKVIKSLEEPKIHFSRNPQAYIRAIRLSSYLKYDISDDLFIFMFQNKNILNNIEKERMTQEGYKIIQTDYPLKSFKLLQDLKIISIENEYDQNLKIPNLSEQIDIKLAYISSIVGIKPLMEFLDFFEFSKRIKDKAFYLMNFLDDSFIYHNSNMLNETITLKRYQYPNDPYKIREILISINKIKNT